jgi:hypothetical protein
MPFVFQYYLRHTFIKACWFPSIILSKHSSQMVLLPHSLQWTTPDSSPVASFLMSLALHNMDMEQMVNNWPPRGLLSMLYCHEMIFSWSWLDTRDVIADYWGVLVSPIPSCCCWSCVFFSRGEKNTPKGQFSAQRQRPRSEWELLLLVQPKSAH